MDNTSSMYEVELRGCPFPTDREQGLYEFCFVWVQTYVVGERGTVCTHGSADYLLENLSREDHGNYAK